MAATHVYAQIISIGPLPGRGTGANVTFTDLTTTPAAFVLAAGQYSILVKASTYGTVTLKVLGPDATTYLTAMTAFAADGMATAYLPDGTYELVIA